MKRYTRAFVIPLLAASLCGVPVVAQEHDEHHDQEHRDQDRRDQDRHGMDRGHNNHSYVRHEEWRKGEHMRHEDWDRGERIDWHQHHLRRPPGGYEWREVDGNYVMAAVATGVIASIVIANSAH